MSEPFLDVADALQGALNEIVSAQSALNMAPDPIIVPDKPDGGVIYLSECDTWAKHSMEHLLAAFELCDRAWREREMLRAQIHRLEIEHARATAQITNLEHDLANAHTANRLLEASLKGRDE